MFFNNASSPEKIKQTAENTVYLLGANAQSVFLYAKFQEAGYYPIILDTPTALSEIRKEDILLKEDILGQRQKFKLHTDFQMKSDGRILLILSDSKNLRANLSLLSPAKLKNLPIVSIGFSEKENLVEETTKTSVTKGYFSCFAEFDKKQLNIFTRDAVLTLSATTDNPAAVFLKEALKSSKIEIKTNEDSTLNFWNNFIPYATASLLSVSTEKNIYALTKNEQERQLISNILNHLISLAETADDCTCSLSDMLKKMYNIPAAYNMPLPKALKKKNLSELNTIIAILNEKSRKTGHLSADLRELLRKICKKTLA